jgi:P63C domain
VQASQAEIEWCQCQQQAPFSERPSQIAGLIDEATGYQDVRNKQALQALLDAYLRKELAAWAKRFPDEFYEHIFRLRGWQWKGRSKNPPQAVAGYTKDIVYARLAPHILEELERKNSIEGGRRKTKHHQWLTDDVGNPALAQHLHAIITLMRVSHNWNQFKTVLDMAHPKRGDTLQLPLMADFPTDLQQARPKQLSLFDRSKSSSVGTK